MPEKPRRYGNLIIRYQGKIRVAIQVPRNSEIIATIPPEIRLETKEYELNEFLTKIGEIYKNLEDLKLRLEK